MLRPINKTPGVKASYKTFNCISLFTVPAGQTCNIKKKKKSNIIEKMQLNGADRRGFFLALCRFSDEKLELHHALPKQENTQGV